VRRLGRRAAQLLILRRTAHPHDPPPPRASRRWGARPELTRAGGACAWTPEFAVSAARQSGELPNPLGARYRIPVRIVHPMELKHTLYEAQIDVSTP